MTTRPCIRFAAKFIAACALSISATASFAHIVLQDGAAAAGASYRAVLRVGHGCDGSATTGVTVLLPAGFNGAQPMPKAGWTVSTKVGPLASPYKAHGKTFTEGVLEISWTANGAENALPDAFYDEFVLRGTTPAKSGPLWFKVVQTCEKGSNAWIEVPASGTSSKGLKYPAALLEVLDVQTAPGGHKH
ncbi:MAG: YcnI family protein [Rhodoferax sp.]|nr:YcnI family protein [Rhodoferax sp.]